jgi:hypothetical protein
METDPVAETLFFLAIHNSERCIKFINRAILSVIHHHQNPLGSTYVAGLTVPLFVTSASRYRRQGTVTLQSVAEQILALI